MVTHTFYPKENQKKSKTKARHYGVALLMLCHGSSFPLSSISAPQQSVKTTLNICEASVSQLCKNHCQRKCWSTLNVRPYANKVGALRITREKCQQKCDEFCFYSPEVLTKKLKSFDAPLAYWIKNFYEQEQCIPCPVNGEKKNLEKVWEEICSAFKNFLTQLSEFFSVQNTG